MHLNIYSSPIKHEKKSIDFWHRSHFNVNKKSVLPLWKFVEYSKLILAITFLKCKKL